MSVLNASEAVNIEQPAYVGTLFAIRTAVGTAVGTGVCVGAGVGVDTSVLVGTGSGLAVGLGLRRSGAAAAVAGAIASDVLPGKDGDTAPPEHPCSTGKHRNALTSMRGTFNDDMKKASVASLATGRFADQSCAASQCAASWTLLQDPSASTHLRHTYQRSLVVGCFGLDVLRDAACTIAYRG